MAITAAQINELRKATGAGMLDCKKALEEVGGDMEQAVDYLRKKGLAAASKKAGRAATEGMVAAAVTASGNAGVLVEINSETDFVAKNDKFQDFVKQIADHVLQKNPANIEELMAQPFVGDASKTIQTLLNEAISVIGENMQIRRFASFNADGGAVGTYIHAGGKIGVLVEASCDKADVCSSEDFATVLKDVAMHTAAASPLFLCREDVCADVLEREKEIYRAKHVKPASRTTSSRRSSVVRSTSFTVTSACWSRSMLRTLTRPFSSTLMPAPNSWVVQSP